MTSGVRCYFMKSIAAQNRSMKSDVSHRFSFNLAQAVSSETVAVITAPLSVTTVLTIAVTPWQDMMHYDTIQCSVKHTDMDFLQKERGAGHAEELYPRL